MTRRATVFCALADNPLFPCRIRDRHRPDCPGKDCREGACRVDGEDLHEGHCTGCLPRTAADGSWLCHHDGRRAQSNLRELVELDQALSLALVPYGGGGGDKVGGTKDVGLSLNETAMDTRSVIRERLAALVTFTVDERGVTGPANWDVRHVIAWLDRHHDWWVNNSASSATTWYVTLALRVKTARSAAYPSGAHRIPTGLTCDQHATSDAGARIPCPGTMTTLAGGNRYSDLVCTADSTHRITPAQWQQTAFRNRLRKPLNPDAVRALHGRITA